MKRIIILLTVVFSSLSADAQTEKEIRNIQNILSHESYGDYGRNVKIIDFDRDLLVSIYSKPETSIRLININDSTFFYFRIVKQELSDSYQIVSLITHEELVEIINCVKKLSTQFNKDKDLEPEYLENRIHCSKKISVGYFVKKLNTEWFIRMTDEFTDHTVFSNKETNYALDARNFKKSTLFFRTSKDLLKVIEKAKDKIDLLMQIK